MALEYDYSVDDEGMHSVPFGILVRGRGMRWGAEKPCLAAHTGCIEMCAFLLAMGARHTCCGGTMMEEALSNKHDQLAVFLAQHADEFYNGEDENWPLRLKRPTNDPLNGLGFAAFLPVSVVKLLLRHGRGNGKETLQCAKPQLRSTPGAKLVLLSSQPWSVKNHELFGADERSKVPFLLWIGAKITGNAASVFTSIDVWRDSVMPFLVTNKRRPVIAPPLASSGFDASVARWCSGTSM